MSPPFDQKQFSNALKALVEEYNIAEHKFKPQHIIIHMPKAWEETKKVEASDILHDFVTESTLEIGIRWEDPVTKYTVDYTALSMVAP